jgi:tRNA-specific 2-thiouridylase
VDEAGQKLAPHQGIIHFTIGQRKGLGLAVGEPLFVLRIDATTQEVVVGPRSSLGQDRVEVVDINWIGPVPRPKTCRLSVKLRSTRQPALADVRFDGNSASVVLDVPQEGVAPGQACVFYDPDHASRVMGGGWIA